MVAGVPDGTAAHPTPGQQPPFAQSGGERLKGDWTGPHVPGLPLASVSWFSFSPRTCAPVQPGVPRLLCPGVSRPRSGQTWQCVTGGDNTAADHVAIARGSRGRGVEGAAASGQVRTRGPGPGAVGLTACARTVPGVFLTPVAAPCGPCPLWPVLCPPCHVACLRVNSPLAQKAPAAQRPAAAQLLPRGVGSSPSPPAAAPLWMGSSRAGASCGLGELGRQQRRGDVLASGGVPEPSWPEVCEPLSALS